MQQVKGRRGMTDIKLDITPLTANEYLLQNRIKELERENHVLRYDARLSPNTTVYTEEDQTSYVPMDHNSTSVVLKAVAGASVHGTDEGHFYLRSFIHNDPGKQVWQYQTRINDFKFLTKRDRITLADRAVKDVMKRMTKAYEE